MAKHFIISPERETVNKQILLQTQIEESKIHKDVQAQREQANRERLTRKEKLSHVQGRVVIKIDVEGKNSHRFDNGMVIRRERQYNEFNRRITEPVNAVVISADYIPAGAEILIGHNSLHDTNKLFNYDNLSGAAEATDVRYYSLPEEDCFAWRGKDGVMKPLKNFEFGLRVFEPYKGVMIGVPPTVLKDKLFVTTGKLSGKVVGTLKSADYEIVYQGLNGKEERLIRFRHSPDSDFEKEEVAYIDHNLTKRVRKGELLVGLSVSDAKKLNDD